jgi:nicotinamidase-related amidase
MERVGEMIRRLKKKLNDIHVTMDMHHYVDVGHPIYWVDSEGNHPEPLKTVISIEDLEKGRWRTTNPNLQKKALDYVRELEANNRYQAIIWPYHCLIGSWGSNVYPPLYDALLDWEKEFNLVDYAPKGSNIYTEHYSAVQADVPDPRDPGTMLNTNLVRTLQEADVIALAGEALNFCLANTVTDIANNFGEENIKKLVLLEDGTSAIPGDEFKPITDKFMNEMTGRGMQISNTRDFLA